MADQRFKRRIGPPGMWEDLDGAVHFNLPDIMEHLNVPYSPENERETEKILREVLAECFPGDDPPVIIKQDACPSCGIVGPGRHKRGCTYGG